MRLRRVLAIRKQFPRLTVIVSADNCVMGFKRIARNDTVEEPIDTILLPIRQQRKDVSVHYR